MKTQLGFVKKAHTPRIVMVLSLETINVCRKRSNGYAATIFAQRRKLLKIYAFSSFGTFLGSRPEQNKVAQNLKIKEAQSNSKAYNKLFNKLDCETRDTSWSRIAILHDVSADSY